MSSQKTFSTQSQLVAGLLAGEGRAVEHWYHLYQARLTHFIAARVSTPQDVQDLVQETFIKSLQSLPHFAGRSSLWTWMCSLAKHEIADYYRKLYAKKVLKLLPLQTSSPPQKYILAPSFPRNSTVSGKKSVIIIKNCSCRNT